MHKTASLRQDETGEWWYHNPRGARQRCKLRTCETCSETFPTFPHGTARFCSQACWRKDCKRCGESFHPNGTRQVYCSDECKLGSASCEECGVTFVPTKKSAGRFCSTQCFYDWKSPVGSRIQHGDGYIIVKVPLDTPGTKRYGTGAPGRWMLEHRYVMQQVLGRPLEQQEQVHHKNGRRDDNRPDNLELWRGSHPHGVRGSDFHCPGCRCSK